MFRRGARILAKTPPTFNALAHAQFTKVTTPQLTGVPDPERPAVIMGAFLKLSLGEVTLLERGAAPGVEPTPATPQQRAQRQAAVSLAAEMKVARIVAHNAAFAWKVASRKLKQLEKDRKKKGKRFDIQQLYRHRAKLKAKAKLVEEQLEAKARAERQFDRAVARAMKLERPLVDGGLLQRADVSMATVEPDTAEDAGAASLQTGRSTTLPTNKSRTPCAVVPPVEGRDLYAVVAEALQRAGDAPVTPEHLVAALQAIRETSAVVDPALSFPKAIQVLRDLKQERFEPFVAVLEAVAQVVSGPPPTTTSMEDLNFIAGCPTIDYLLPVYNPEQPLVHPVAVLASLCAHLFAVPLLENPTTADVADHFDVPLQGCEPFFMQLARMFESVIEGQPSTVQLAATLVLRDVSQSGKTYKSLAIVSGFHQLAETNDEYAWLKGRKVVPLYIGFGGTASLTRAEKDYIKGERGLRAVLYARIAAAATAVANDPSLVALPENRGALAKTLSVPEGSVVNLQHVRQVTASSLEATANTALKHLAQTETLKGPQGEPPLVVIVVDDGQVLDGLDGFPMLPHAVAHDGGSTNGSRLALRVCRELQAELSAQLPVVGLMVGTNPHTDLSTTGSGYNTSAPRRLPTSEEFAAIVAHRLPHLSAAHRALVCAARFPRCRDLPDSLDELGAVIRTRKVQGRDLERLIGAVCDSLSKHRGREYSVVDVPYVGRDPHADFLCFANLHSSITKTSGNVSLVHTLLRAVPQGDFKTTSWVLLGIAAEFVMTGTLAEEVGKVVYEFFNIDGFRALESMTLVDLTRVPHPFEETTGGSLSHDVLAALRALAPHHAVLFRAENAPWDFVLVVNIGGTLHFRYAAVHSPAAPTEMRKPVCDCHRRVAAAAQRDGFKVSGRTVGAVIALTDTDASFAPHVKLDRRSWCMGPLTEVFFHVHHFMATEDE